MLSLAGNKTLIAGGTSGIGRALAEHFVAAGAKVVNTGRHARGQTLSPKSAPILLR